jgi:hypothetical protein
MKTKRLPALLIATNGSLAVNSNNNSNSNSNTQNPVDAAVAAIQGNLQK